MGNTSANPRWRVSRKLAVATGLAVVAVAGVLGFAVAIASLVAARKWRVFRSDGLAAFASVVQVAAALAAALAAVLLAAVVVARFSAAVSSVV